MKLRHTAGETEIKDWQRSFNRHSGGRGYREEPVWLENGWRDDGLEGRRDKFMWRLSGKASWWEGQSEE